MTLDVTVELSLGEIDALCVKAARGAGFSWGMAQEVGRAARTLALWHVRWEDALSRHLTEIDGDVRTHAPRMAEGRWTAAPNDLCPIGLGTALMDFGHALGTAGTHVAAVRYPVLLLPFLSAIAAARGGHVGLASAAYRGLISAEGAGLGDPPTEARWPDARVWHDPRPPAGEPRHAAAPYPMKRDALAILERLAHRTYVPESEESRATGAGAGASDND
jgi:hypothetical protein